MLRRWKTISSTIVSTNPWWTYKRDTFQIPGGITGEYHYVHTEGSSLIVPVRDDGKLVMVNQYRYLCERESLEFPCGGVKIGKSHDEMARLELEEETGYTSADMERVGEFDPYNGVTNEICAVYVARQLKVSTAKPDATEEFEILAISPSELDEMINRRSVWDGMTLAAWALVKSAVTAK